MFDRVLNSHMQALIFVYNVVHGLAAWPYVHNICLINENYNSVS